MTFKDFFFMEDKKPILEDSDYLIEIATPSGDIVNPKNIHDIIKATGQKPTIIGGHAFNVLARTKRSTQDVDLLTNDPQEAAHVVLAANPQWHLDDRSNPYQQRILNDKDEEVVDIIAYNAKPVWNDVQKGSSLKGGYRIPNLENFIAMKWASMTNPMRSKEGKIRDESDIKTLLWQNMANWAPATRANTKERKKIFDEVTKASQTADDMLNFEELFKQLETEFLKGK